jgi:hypothetical protein
MKAGPGRPPGTENKDKPFREALRMELAAMGEDLKGLRKIAKRVITEAAAGDMQAAFQIRDTLDGKPVQSTEISGKDGGAIQVDTLTTQDRARALAAFVAKTKADK